MSTYPIAFYGDVPFCVAPLQNWPIWAGPGVYMFCRRDVSGARAILYIGQTSDLFSRVGPAHEHWFEALALQMNEILVHLSAGTEADRLAVETQLRHLHPTPLNRQGSERQLADLLRGLRRSQPLSLVGPLPR